MKQNTLWTGENETVHDLLTLQEASIWATKFLGKNVTASNISYLVQYGRIPKSKLNGNVVVSQLDLEEYYSTQIGTKAEQWKNKLGDDLNWSLSFSEYSESETTKHVHRLHPYKGKFIPQLVEYFLDSHTDDFKTQVFFNEGNIILDPFCGSGTTLVQANELGIHAVGIDVSEFNAFISNAKVGSYNILKIQDTASKITQRLTDFKRSIGNSNFEKDLLEKLKMFNSQFFPSPEFRYKVRMGEVDEQRYGREKSAEFLKTYYKLVDRYGIELEQGRAESFTEKWFLKVIKTEIDFVYKEVDAIECESTRKLLGLILSRTIRSCRATTHADLGTLKEPKVETYYCKKHGKICKPLFSILSWWQRYIKDTVKRVQQFDSLRTSALQNCLVGDSREINILNSLANNSPKLSKLAKQKGIDGIFSSPPYVGLIDYHEQHAYAYDLFGFDRNDESEIGPLYKGQGKEAQKSYVKGISEVLLNCKKYLKPNYNVFLVANDKHGLYAQIAKRSGMQIVKEYKRPVLNRVEKDRSAYAEIIFHLKEE